MTKSECDKILFDLVKQVSEHKREIAALETSLDKTENEFQYLRHKLRNSKDGELPEDVDHADLCERVARLPEDMKRLHKIREEKATAIARLKDAGIEIN